jgi:hypothetical protein
MDVTILDFWESMTSMAFSDRACKSLLTSLLIKAGFFCGRQIEGSMALASLSRLATSSVAKFPDKICAVTVFKTCLMLTDEDLKSKVSSSLVVIKV